MVMLTESDKKGVRRRRARRRIISIKPQACFMIQAHIQSIGVFINNKSTVTYNFENRALGDCLFNIRRKIILCNCKTNKYPSGMKIESQE
jgi:hypothetical protein